MIIEYLHKFVTIAHSGSFFEAAERLNISQSSLSKHIRVLEEELSVAVCERTARTAASGL